MSSTATYQSANLGLPATPLTEDPKLYYELLRIYNAIRVVMQAVDNNTGAISPPEDYWSELKFSRCTIGNTSKIYVKAYEALNYGSTVGMIASSGEYKAAKAQAGVRKCIGFCSAVEGAAAGDYTEIQLLGLYAPFATGTLTAGNIYYQSATAGVVGVSGDQVIGYALSDTQLFFNPQL